jgi:sec-independent protein translocase protein TatB
MFNVGGAELFVILLLALVVLGPDKLPGAMRTVGQWAGEMRKMASGFQTEMNKAMSDPLDVKGAEKKAAEAKQGDAAPSKGTTTPTSDATETGGTTSSKAGDATAEGAPSNGSASNGSTSNGSSADEAAGDAPAVSD